MSGQPKQSGQNMRLLARRFVTMPDGSRKEFRRDDALHNPGEDMSDIYYAVDGSRMKYDLLSDTLYLPDGSRYEPVKDGAGNVTGRRYIDRNGN